MKMTNEKILHVKAKWDEIGFTKFPENFDIVGAFKELREWFKWDMKKYPYDNITNPTEYNTSYPETNYKLKDDLHDATVMSIIGILNYAENQNLTNNLNYKKIDKIIYGFDSFYIYDGDLDGYYNYFKVLLDIGISATDSSYIGGTIRNRMGTDDFETFFRKYKAILRKHATLELSTVPECNTTVTTIDTMATNAVSLEAEYGFVPAAHLALQCNPVGLWYMYQQTGKYRSQFVDYSELDKSSDNMALNHIEAITKLMMKRTVYQMILQEMPEIGTAINGNTIKLTIAGYNAFKVGLLAVKDDEHVLAIIYDMASDNAQGISGDKKNVDDWIARKLAD